MSVPSPSPAFGVPDRHALEADLALALRLADAADAQSLPRFDAPDLDVRSKPDRSRVTDADLAVERAIREVLASERPEDGVFGEEYGSTGDAHRQWIIDPIDGTHGYLRGIPLWGTMICLAVEGVPHVGVVSSPALGRRWWAATGLGAWAASGAAEPQRIAASSIDTISEASVSTQSVQQWDRAGRLDALTALSRAVWRDRAFGDVWSYMLLAEGRLELVAEFGLQIYDIAAAVPIISEAGGRVTALDGGETLTSGSTLASNGLLHDAFIDLLAAHPATLTETVS